MALLYQNRMDNTIRILVAIVAMVSIGSNIASAIRVRTDQEVFVPLNTRRELKCDFAYKKEISSVTWKKGPRDGDAEDVVAYFMGWKKGPMYPNKGYDIAADNSTLIIENVKESDAGTWWCIVVVTDPGQGKGATNVTVTVPPTPPTISQCPTGQPCEIQVDKDDTNYTVTCTATGSKPAVTLVLYQDDQKLEADAQKRENADDPEQYDTILEIPVSLDSDQDEFVITCEAVGHHSLPDSDKRAKQVLTIQRNKNDPTMKSHEVDTIKIGIYAGVGAVVAIALIISIIIAAFVVSSKMQPSPSRSKYRGAKKKKKRHSSRPRFPSPPPSPDPEGRTTQSSIHSDLGLNDSDSEKHDYENLPKGIRNGLCTKSPVYQSPVSAC